MYIPALNRQDDPETLLAFMQRNNFATLVSQLEGQLIASHIPVVVTHAGEAFYISGHLAKANPHVQALNSELLVIFTGPHAYISPQHYDSTQNVPTWNYTAVHAYGQPETLRFGDKPQDLTGDISELIAQHEAAYQQQWDSLSERYRHGMLQGVVGFRMQVTRLEGKYKLSQNRSNTEQHRIIDALKRHPDTDISGVAELMAEQSDADKD